MKVPQAWEDYAEDYRNGYYFAEGDYQDDLEYNKLFHANHLEEAVRQEAYVQGYYDFWETVNFGTGEY